MGLYKRGQVWWMSFSYKGEQKRFSTEAADKKVAEKIYHKVMTQVAEGKWFERLPGEESLLAASPVWLQEIIIFAINTGLRQGEILNLAWNRVDLFRKTVTILKQKNKGKDTLPLNNKAMDVLKARARVRHIKTNYVFYNGNGNMIEARNLLRAFYSAVRKGVLKGLRFHDLRHTFATRLLQAGVDIYTVQKLGRWKTTSMINRYAHHYSESLRPGVERLDKVEEKVITNLSQFERSEIAGAT